MLKRIFSITARDFKSNVREFILLYILVAPFLLALGLTAFIPSLESASMQFATGPGVDTNLIEHLEKYGSVEQFGSQLAVKERLISIDEVIGISQENESFKIVLYGDERDSTVELASKILKAYTLDAGKQEYKFSSLGNKESPVALTGTVSLIAMALSLGGGIIGLNIIEEKEEGTIKAIVTSPVNRLEFIIGKSLTGAVTALVQTFGILFIVGYGNVNMIQTLFFTLVSLSMLVLFGFLIGVLSSNQVMGLANLKFMFLPISISIIGAVVIPTSLQFTLYWSPFYWSYLGYAKILQGVASWSNLLLYSMCIFSIFILVFLFTRKRIIKGLS